MSHKYVYLFTEGNGTMRELLGGKGANLAEMTNIGLPVPQGFTISTEACTKYYEDGRMINDDIQSGIFVETPFLSHIVTRELALRCPLWSKDNLLGIHGNASRHQHYKKQQPVFHRDIELFQQQPVLIQFHMQDTLTSVNPLFQNIAESLKKAQTQIVLTAGLIYK